MGTGAQKIGYKDLGCRREARPEGVDLRISRCMAVKNHRSAGDFLGTFAYKRGVAEMDLEANVQNL